MRAHLKAYGAVVTSASETLDLTLQVGRVLRGRLLALVVLVRELPLVYLSAGTSRVAPAWVVVRDRQQGNELLRVRAGRELGAGESILAAMSTEAAEMDRETFLARWRERR